MAGINIPFNKPFFTGMEIEYIQNAVNRGHISGNGYYTKKCQEFFEDRYGFKKCLLTTSCTDALEMAAILVDIKPGDEVIMPSFTFVSTANAFVLRGARIVFVDSREDHPGMDEKSIEHLITPKTKVIVPVHYAGVACDMDVIMGIADKYGLLVVEDAAQAIDNHYKGKPLGGIGHLGCFSFHETKNINCGEGGMLVINDERFSERAEIIWEKGTNRSAFFRGEVNKYGWVDVGSSFLPSDILAAVLYAQFNELDVIQAKRNEIWSEYRNSLTFLERHDKIKLPVIPEYSGNNAHMFYLILESEEVRSGLSAYLKTKGIMAVFHYQSLHRSKFYGSEHDGRILSRSENYSSRLLRLPFYHEVLSHLSYINASVIEYFGID